MTSSRTPAHSLVDLADASLILVKCSARDNAAENKLLNIARLRRSDSARQEKFL